jgi:hypothetical protein
MSGPASGVRDLSRGILDRFPIPVARTFLLPAHCSCSPSGFQFVSIQTYWKRCSFSALDSSPRT